MTSNKKRKLRRAEKDSANKTLPPGQAKITQTEGVLFGGLSDLRLSVGKDLIGIKSDISRIDRETTQFFQTKFNPLVQNFNSIDSKLDILIDKFLEVFPNTEFTEKEMKSLNLEYEEVKKEKSKEKPNEKNGPEKKEETIKAQEKKDDKS